MSSSLMGRCSAYESEPSSPGSSCRRSNTRSWFASAIVSAPTCCRSFSSLSRRRSSSRSRRSSASRSLSRTGGSHLMIPTTPPPRPPRPSPATPPPPLGAEAPGTLKSFLPCVPFEPPRPPPRPPRPPREGGAAEARVALRPEYMLPPPSAALVRTASETHGAGALVRNAWLIRRGARLQYRPQHVGVWLARARLRGYGRRNFSGFILPGAHHFFHSTALAAHSHPR